jgi:hypothetical protein
MGYMRGCIEQKVIKWSEVDHDYCSTNQQTINCIVMKKQINCNSSMCHPLIVITKSFHLIII